MPRTTWVRPYRRRNGVQVRGHWRGSPPGQGFSRGVTLAITLTITLGGIGALTFSTNGGISIVRPSGSSDRTGQCGASQKCTEIEISTDGLRSFEERLATRGLNANGNLEHDGAHCADHSYGQVRTFFRDHQCSDLYRAQITVQDKVGDVVLIAASLVRMATKQNADSFHRLVDTYGTGNIVELSRESGPYRSARYTGRNYCSVQDRSAVMNVQAELTGNRWTGPTLKEILREITPRHEPSGSCSTTVS